LKKATNRQYSTDDHDVHTITLEEYKKAIKKIKWKRISRTKEKVYFRQSTFADIGEKVW